MLKMFYYFKKWYIPILDESMDALTRAALRGLILNQVVQRVTYVLNVNSIAVLPITDWTNNWYPSQRRIFIFIDYIE